MDKLKKLLSSRSFIGSVISIIAIAAIAFIYFYPDAAQGNQLRQHDMQQGAAIGQEAKLFHEATGETTRWTNSLFGGMPTFQIAPSYPSDSLFSWLNTVFGLGLPNPANLLAMMMLGFFILLMSMKMRWYVALVGAIAYGFSSYFIIIIGAGHIWKFVVLAYVPPTIAGLILCYRGRLLAGAALTAIFSMLQISNNHVQMSYYFLFVMLGLAIAFLVKAIRKGTVRKWAVATAVLAAAGGLGVVANLPNLYNTYEYSKYTMRGGHSELNRSTGNPEATSGLDRDYITQYSYGASESFSLLIPNVKGGASNKPEKGQNNILSLSSLPQAKEMVSDGELSPQEARYLDFISQYFGEPEGTNGPVYVGALVCALFLLGCVIVKGPVKWALLVLTALSVLLALGRNCMWLTDLMIDYMPMYSKFRTVESILVIAEFTMPLLAAMTLQKLISGRDRWAEYRKPFIWCFGITAGICLLAAVAPGIFGSVITDGDRNIDSILSQQLLQQGYDQATAATFSLQNPRIYNAVESLRQSMISADALRSLLFIAAGAVTLLLFFYRKLSAAAAVLVCGVVVLTDLFSVNKRYLDTESFMPRQLAQADPFPLSDADRTILADTAANYRVMDIPRFWQAAPSYHHKTVGGYHAAKLTRFQDLIDTHLGNFLNGSQTDADWEVLNMLNARYIIDPTGAPLFNPEAFGNAWLVDSVAFVDGADAEMAALSVIQPRTAAVADRSFASSIKLPAPTQPGDTIFETSYAPNRLTYHVSAAGPALAVFSEVYFPWGWHATVDGKPADISRVNYLLRAVNIPAGSHTVEMWFDPKSLHTTTTAATISIILIYLIAAAALAMALKGRKPSGNNDETGSVD
ncbi:MAG: YfhO family protein [Muribaculaceae bacterium]|nr:YfhO family protein [Muribaculaceae bacterium]